MRDRDETSVDAENAARAGVPDSREPCLSREIRDVIHVMPQEIRTLWPRLQDQRRRASPVK